MSSNFYSNSTMKSRDITFHFNNKINRNSYLITGFPVKCLQALPVHAKFSYSDRNKVRLFISFSDFYVLPTGVCRNYSYFIFTSILSLRGWGLEIRTFSR